MTFPRAVDRRMTAFAILLYSLPSRLPHKALRYPEQPLQAATQRWRLPACRWQATAEAPAAAASDAQIATASNACETQNWPYYSKGCLHGEGARPAPRQVHLQPASTTPTAASPVPLANATARQSSERRQITATPHRRRKVRQKPRYASRPVLSVRQMQQPEPEGFGHAPAFTW
jgi:hypothetical protein